MYVIGSKSFRPDQVFKVTEMKQLCYFSTQSPFISTHFSTDTLTSPKMALFIPHSIFHLALLLYVRPETFGPYCVFPRLTRRTMRLLPHKSFWHSVLMKSRGKNILWLEVSIVLTMNAVFFCCVAPCSLVDKNQRFGGKYTPHLRRCTASQARRKQSLYF